MAGLGVATCGYNMLEIRMYVGQTKEPHNFAPSGSCAWEPSHHTQWKALQSQVYRVLPIHLVKESLYIKLKC